MIGLANNGEFWRMSDWGALKPVQTPWTDVYFDWVTPDYKFVGNPANGQGCVAVFRKSICESSGGALVLGNLRSVLRSEGAGTDAYSGVRA